MNLRILGVCLCLVPALSGATATVYKCDDHGKLTYTDRPCDAGAIATELPMLNIAAEPTASERALARRHDERLGQAIGARDRDDAAWLKEHARSADREARVHKAIVEHRVIKGMTAEEVNQSLGTPDQVASSESFGSDKETWTYTVDGKTRTINFKDRQVTTTSARQKTRRKGR